MSNLHQFSTRTTPQSQPIPGSKQVANSAGGFSFQVDPWARLERFLILGTDGGTYYIKPPELTKANAENALALLEADGRRFVDTVVAISVAGRNIKQEPVQFAMAMAAGAKNEDTRKYALSKLNLVARTGTQLFLFASFVGQFRGWGKSLRRAVGDWYTQDVAKVAYQAAKYRQREGWTHADLLRKAHVAGFEYGGDNPTVNVTPEHKALFAWIKDRSTPPEAGWVDDLRVLEAFERAQASGSVDETVSLIAEYGGLLSWEMLRTEHTATAEVQRALIDQVMPLGALTRNLANMTRYGVFDERAYISKVVKQLTNEEAVGKSRLHPYAVLVAMKTYAQGYSMTNAQTTWKPVGQIVDALDTAFYLAFGNVEPTGKRIRYAIDASGSMGGSLVGGFRKGRGGHWEAVRSPVSCSEGAAAMTMVSARVESDYDIVLFADGGHGRRYGAGRWGRGNALKPVAITPRQRLDDVARTVQDNTWGGTDCALPMLDALNTGAEFDAFVVLTDNETWYGDIHPTQALEQYREKTGIPAKLVVVSMTANDFTIADPGDAGMLDVVGFDTAAPGFIADFIKA
jgi:60 kDa SS-A/Ro ribonucleoprotein